MRFEKNPEAPPYPFSHEPAHSLRRAKGQFFFRWAYYPPYEPFPQYLCLISFQRDIWQLNAKTLRINIRTHSSLRGQLKLLFMYADWNFPLLILILHKWQIKWKSVWNTGIGIGMLNLGFNFLTQSEIWYYHGHFHTYKHSEMEYSELSV